MHWLWFALISVTAFSVSSLFQRVAMKEEASDPITSAIIFQLLLGLLCFIVALFFGFHLPAIMLWKYFTISACLYACGTLSFFKASKQIEASELSILAGFGTLITIIASYIFLFERLSPDQLVGAILILLAIVIVNYSHTGVKFHSGVWFALLGTSCYGLAVVIDGFILRSFDTFSFIPITSLLSGSVMLLAFPKKIPKLFHDIKRINKNLVLYSATYVIGAEMFYIPLQNGTLVSQMSAINRVSIILTVILAMIFLKERSHPRKKLAGAILTTIGIFLIR